MQGKRTSAADWLSSLAAATRGVREWDPRICRMTVDERPNERNQLLPLILQDVMPSVLERVDLGRGEAAHPLFEEVAVEDEVLQSPADHHGHVGEPAEAILNLGHHVVATIAGAERDVLDEPMDGNAIRPGIVR